MSLQKYKIWAIGTPVNRGITGAVHVGVSGIAKSDAAGPNIVLNEFICNYLAKAILLPTPIGFIIDKNGEPNYVSLNFNLSGHDLPPADVNTIIAQHPVIASGIVVFDIWILNSDRHNQNISYHATSNQIQVFDHSHALFGFGDIRDHLTNNKAKAIDRHCLASEMTTVDGIKEWINRINQIPDFYIKEVVGYGKEFGLPASIIPFCEDFILERRQKLLSFIKNNSLLFPKISQSEWDKLN